MTPNCFTQGKTCLRVGLLKSIGVDVVLFRRILGHLEIVQQRCLQLSSTSVSRGGPQKAKTRNNHLKRLVGHALLLSLFGAIEVHVRLYVIYEYSIC